MKKSERFFTVLCSLVILLTTLYALLHFFTSGGQGNMTVTGAQCFRYFTVDSNLLMAAVSVPVLCCALRGRPFSPVLRVLRYLSASAVTLTMMTVLAFLGPIMGYRAMFAGPNLYMHLTTPLLAVFLQIFTDNRTRMAKGTVLFSLIPTAIYGAVYILQVLIRRVWPDFYSFASGGLWYVSLIAMFLGTLLLGWALWGLRKAAGKTRT